MNKYTADENDQSSSKLNIDSIFNIEFLILTASNKQKNRVSTNPNQYGGKTPDFPEAAARSGPSSQKSAVSLGTA